MVFQYRSAWISDDKPHEKLSHQFDKPKRSVASPEALEALRNNNAVRWYVLSLPDCHRGGVRGLQRNRTAAYRQASPHSAFAPSYQEVRRIDGKFVNTQRPLLFNYVFVRASERDVFQLMQRFPVLSFLPRVRERKREYFPYLPMPQWRICSGWPVLIPIHFLFIYPSRMVCARATGYALPRDGLRWRRLLSFSREPGERM